jgi:O-antigen/teichoic acid export membrane protein
MTRPLLLIAAARTISVALGILLLGVLGRRLGAAGFGTLQFALALMVYPALVVDLGLTTLGLREIARGGGSVDVVPRVLGARLFLAMAVGIVVIAALFMLPLDAETRTIVLILTLGLPVSAWNLRWVLQGERRFGRAAIAEVLTTGTQLIAALVLVRSNDDTVRAAGALTLATIVATVASIVLAGQAGRVRPGLGRGVIDDIVHSLPLGAAGIAIAIYYSIDVVLLGLFRGQEEVAFYAGAYRIIMPILALASAVAIVAIPHLSFLNVSDETAAGPAATNLSRRLIIVAVPIATGGALTAEAIIAAVYGSAFAPAADPFRVLIWSVVTVYANAAFAFLLLSRQGDRRYLAVTLAGAVLNVGLNLVVIPIAGMIGAAFTTMASEVLVLGLILWWTRDVSLRAVRDAFAAAAVPTLAMAIAVWPFRSSLLAVPIGILAYGLVATATGIIPLRRLLSRRTAVET